MHEAGFTLRWSVNGTRIETLRPDGTLIDLGRPRIEGPVPTRAGPAREPVGP